MTDKQKRHRASREEMCARHKNKRSKLYGERNRLKKAIQSNPSDPKLANRLMVLDGKITTQTTKLFKCGKRYAKLKEKKRKLTSKIKYLCKSIEKRDLEMEGKKISAKEKKKEASIKKSKCKELAKLDDELNKLKSLMGLNIHGFKPTDLDVAPHVPSGNIFSTNVGIWDLTSNVIDILDSNIYDLIYLDGLDYSIPKNNFELLNDVKERVDEMTEQRKEGGNYQVIIEFDRVMKKIRITTA